MDEDDNSKSLKRTSLDLDQDETDPTTSSTNDESITKKPRVDHEDAAMENDQSEGDESEQGTDSSLFKGHFRLWTL
jgi:hypothetical protein